MLGQIVSHYKILEKLGQGGMGVVYKAEDTKLKRTVALKFLPPDLTGDAEAKERFLHEARTASVLEHGNICTIHEINETEDGQLFICMAYCEGEELKKKIQRGSLKIDETIDITIQVVEGLKEAHEKGIIHRDIKSGNIMVTTKGQAKITDFGLAKLAGRSTLTKTGSTMGTIAYMSPEQARGEKVDSRTDIWSLGVVLYEMLTGKLPFQSEYEQAVVYSILYEDPKPVMELNNNVSESLDSIVKKTLEKDPARRYQSAVELLTDLRAVKGGLEIFEGPESKRKVNRAVLFSFVLVLALSLIFLYVRHRGNQVPRKISIGVMFFDNQTGEDKYDYLRKVLADMLTTTLAPSRYLKVMTFPEMLDGLKSLGYEDTKIISDSLWFKLCRLKGVQVMVLGSLTKSGDTFVLNSRLLNVDTKTQLATPFMVIGKGEGSILGHLVDDLTDRIKRGIRISMKEIQEEKKDIAELTTTSLEAYQYYFKGKEAAYRMDNQEAINYLEKAVALDSTFVDAYSSLARMYYFVQEYPKALKIIKKVKTIATSSGKGTEEQLVTILALEAYINQDWNLAINYYKSLISTNPENILAHLDLGTIYYQYKGMYDQGIAEFKRVLELDSKGVTHDVSFTYNLLGWAYLRKGEKEKALDSYKKYVSFSPNQAYPFDVLAEVNLFAGNYDQTLNNLHKSLELKPDYPVTFALFGDAYLAMGMYKEASSSYEKYQALCLNTSDQADAHFSLSKLYYLKGDNEKSIWESKKALEFDPQMIKAHWIRGLTFVREKMFDQADSEVTIIKGLISEAKTEDSKAPYYHLSGELSLSRGLYQQALENFSQAAVIWSLERPFYLNAWGEAYFRMGELNKAKEKFEEVLEINPNYAQTHYLLGQLYLKQGKKDMAKRHLQKFTEIWKQADENTPQLMEVSGWLKKL